MLLPTDRHTWLLDRMLTLIPKTDKEGVCYGIACMAMQAFLAGEIEIFYQRLRLIHAIPTDVFKETIEAIKEKHIKNIKKIKEQTQPLTNQQIDDLSANPDIQKSLQQLKELINKLYEGKIRKEDITAEFERRKKIYLNNFHLQKKIEEYKLTLTKEQRLQLDIQTFIEGIELYQDPEFYPHLFDPDTSLLNQDSAVVFQLLTPVSLEDNRIKNLKNFPGIYDFEKNQLQDYFDCLAKSLEGSGAAISILLISAAHTVMVGYDDKKRTWRCIDAVDLNETYLESKSIALTVKNALSANNYMTFRSRIFVLDSKADIVNKCLSTWQHLPKIKVLHEVNLENVNWKDSTGTSWLHIAAHGYSDVVQKILDLKVNCNQPNLLHMTPLSYAAYGGHTETVKLLLSAGARPNFMDGAGETPLFDAAAAGHTDIVKLLLSAGALPNKKADNGITPLYLAVKSRNLNCVTAIIQAFSSPQELDEALNTLLYNPLEVAVENNDTAIACLLLAFHADPNFPNSRRLLNIAETNKNNTLLQLLYFNGADPKIPIDEDNTNLLFRALLTQRTQMVEEILKDEDVDPNEAQLIEGKMVTPLLFAVQHGKIDFVESLLNAGADIDLALTDGTTALLLATELGQTEMIEVLISRDAYVDLTRTGKNLSPLHAAVYAERADIVEILLNHDADPNIKKSNGIDPLSTAAFKNNYHIAKLLLENGANPNNTAKNGATALFFAAQQGSIEIVKLLIDKTDPSHTFRVTAEELRHFAKKRNVEAAIEKIITTHKYSSNQTICLTPKMIAEIMGHKEIVDLFKQHPNYQDLETLEDEVSEENSLTNINPVYTTESQAYIMYEPHYTDELNKFLAQHPNADPKVAKQKFKETLSGYKAQQFYKSTLFTSDKNADSSKAKNEPVITSPTDRSDEIINSNKSNQSIFSSKYSYTPGKHKLAVSNEEKPPKKSKT